jgi:hypothetical protein
MRKAQGISPSTISKDITELGVALESAAPLFSIRVDPAPLADAKMAAEYGADLRIAKA